MQQEKNQPWVVPFSIIVAGALIAAGLYFGNGRSPEPARQAGTQGAMQGADTINVKPVSNNDWIVGNPKADVVVIEFSDPECPFCKQFHTTMKRVMDEYGAGGRVAWVYRHFPIAQLHPGAPKIAEGMECAGNLGGNTKFWEFADKVYARPQNATPLDTAGMEAIAREIGLDTGKWNECLSSGRMAAEVNADTQDGVAAGVNGTPHSIVVTRSGERVAIRGAQPFEAVKIIIDTALQAQ
jgi:protein-disulfide isomerase